MPPEPCFPDDLFMRHDLGALRTDENGLRRALRAGSVRRVARGVYVRSDVEDTFDLRVAAVSMSMAPDHVACDRTAAWLHGVDVFAHAELEVLPRVEMCALPDRWASRTAGARGRSRDLLPRDIGRSHGILTTTPLRTALDLACNVQRRDALAALDAFRREHGITGEQLEAELPRFRRRRGVVQARDLLRLVDGRTESIRESWVRLALVDAGLPLPNVQVWVDRNGVPTYRLDLAYPAHRVAIEYDGEAFHRSPRDRAYDEARRDWLRDQGWTVVVVRNGDFAGPALERWIARVREALDGRYCNLRW